MFFREDEIRRIKQEEEAKATLKREAAEKLRQREIDVLKAEQAEKRVKFKLLDVWAPFFKGDHNKFSRGITIYSRYFCKYLFNY